MVAKNEMEIILTGRDQATGQLKQNILGLEKTGQTTTQSLRKNWLAVTAAVVAATYAVKKITEAYVNFNKELIKVNSTMEQYRVRMISLLGSTEEGTKVFEDMTDLASRVPKTFEEIMESATNLSAVVRGGSDEIKQLMPIIVDLASGTGMSVQEVTGQIIRMYSAGAASADMFRERGVSAALGFKAGVSYSTQETMDIILKQWEDGTGKFVGASDKLAATWEGQVSMMQDAWFKFKSDVGEKLFESVKTDLSGIVALINQAKDEGGEYQDVVDKTADLFNDIYESAKEFTGILIAAGGQIKDTWNEVAFAVAAIYEKMLQLADFVNDYPALFGAMGAGVAASYNQEELEQELQAVGILLDELAVKAETDFSQNWQSVFQEIINKIHIMGVEMQKLTPITVNAAKETANQTKSLYTSFAEFVKSIDKAQLEGMYSLASASANLMGELATMTGEIWLKMAEIIVNTVVQVVKVIVEAVNSTLGPIGWLTAGLEIAALSIGAANAIAQIEASRKALDEMKSKTATPTVNVPALGTGGIVTSPTFALVGERGPEAVIPLNRMQGNNVYVEINNPVIRNNEDIDNLVQRISDIFAAESERAYA